MSLQSVLIDNHKFVSVELIWASQPKEKQQQAFRMLEQGELLSRGRLILMDNSQFGSGLGNFFDIPQEKWNDVDQEVWDVSVQKCGQFNLQGFHPDDVITNIQMYNSEQLREFAEFEVPLISIDEYDARLFNANGTKMGTKVWARAAAVLAAERVEPTAGKLTEYLLKEHDIWMNGKVDDRNLKKNLAPFLAEFKKLRG